MSKAATNLLMHLQSCGAITPQLAADYKNLPAAQVIPRLIESDLEPSLISDSIAEVFNYTIFNSSNDENVIYDSSGYTVTDDVAYVVNPLDVNLVSKIGSSYPVAKFGVKTYVRSAGTILAEDIDDDDFSEEESKKFVDTTIAYAVSMNASDIHIEPDHNRVTVRIRVDGKLQSVPKASINHNSYYAIANNLLSRADKTTGDYINPKDGEFTWENEGTDTKIQIRLSMVPAAIDASIDLKETNYPGTFVLRLAGQDRGLQNIDSLGLSESQLADLKHVLRAPHGLFLVTGPTGSGKTTTLYGALRHLQNIRPDWAFRTAENPVEVNLRGITQTQIDNQAGASFERVLRALLRQDPDLILVGEIRDQETLETAMDAAMTGHFVMATLHANSATQAIHRFIRMGAEADMLADVLVATSAQRVVPKLCTHCSIPKPVSDVLATADEQSILVSRNVQSLSVANSAGCDHCTHGYSGRQMIAEINRPSKSQKRVISENLSLVHISEQAEKDGFVNMWARAVQLISEGVIDYASADSALGDITQFLNPISTENT